jgi:hypothetical protein
MLPHDLMTEIMLLNKTYDRELTDSKYSMKLFGTSLLWTMT